MTNEETHIFAPIRSIVGIRSADAKEIERLNGHRQTAAFYIGLAQAALSEGKWAQADAYLIRALTAATAKE